MIDLEKLQSSFKENFNTNNSPRIYFSPGRINLMGEHIDYNGGYVVAAAVNMGTYAAAYPNKQNEIRLFSLNYKEVGIVKTHIRDISYRKEQEWANYPLGVIHTFQKKGFKLNQGLDIVFSGDIPHNSGLSSSASIELATAEALKDLFDFKLNKIETAVLCRESENNFNGVSCGIMDQFVCSMGEENKVILLKSDTLKYKLVPFLSKKHSFIIINSNINRNLSDSKYNERVKECDSALKDLKKIKKTKNLCSLDTKEFNKYKDKIKNITHRKRAEHVVEENYRTKLATKALENKELNLFGKLMYESHKSLHYNYEVSIPHLDTLVELSEKEGALGSKMTGAGFGGCTVSLIPNNIISDFIKNIKREYKIKYSIDADIYIVKISKGAQRIK